MNKAITSFLFILLGGCLSAQTVGNQIQLNDDSAIFTRWENVYIGKG